jgi:hypothetical protein
MHTAYWQMGAKSLQLGAKAKEGRALKQLEADAVAE